MVEKKKTEKLKNTKIRVKRYERDGKSVKGHPKWVDKYPKKYRTFRKINRHVRFVEVTRTGKKYRVKILDGRVGQPVRASVLEINQSNKTKHFLPNKKFMKKELSKREIEAFMKLAESSDEKSFALDFERYLNNPERIAITKGGRTSTMKLDDFELFGHSHPLTSKNQKMPSITDLRNMKTLYPEFLIAYDQYGLDKTPEMYFFLVEDVEKYDAWTIRKVHTDPKTEHPISDFELSSEKAKLKAFEKNGKKKEIIDSITMNTIFESEEGRTIFYNLTGVKIYPYDPTIYGVKLELPDDPKREYALIPSASKESLKDWTWSSNPYKSEAKTKEMIAQKRKEFTDTSINVLHPPGLEEQLNASQWTLSYLRDQQKEGNMNDYVVQKEIEQEVAHYQELVRKLEEEQKKSEKAFELGLKEHQINEERNQEQLKKRKNYKKERKIITDIPTLNDKDYLDYIKGRDIGGCGASAKVLAEKGYGTLVCGHYNKTDHFWVKTPDNEIIDLFPLEPSPEYAKYRELNTMDSKENPDPNCWDENDFEYWRKRIPLK